MLVYLDMLFFFLLWISALCIFQSKIKVFPKLKYIFPCLSALISMILFSDNDKENDEYETKENFTDCDKEIECYEKRYQFFINKFRNHYNTLTNEEFKDLALSTKHYSQKELEHVFNDLLNITERFNKDAEYFVIGHGYDKNENEKDGLYVAVQKGTDESFNMTKTTKFIDNIAQIPITKEIMYAYLVCKENKLPFSYLPEYKGPVYSKNSIQNLIEKDEIIKAQNEECFIGSYFAGLIIFYLTWLASKTILKDQIDQNPKLKYIFPIVSLIISLLVIYYIFQVSLFIKNKRFLIQLDSNFC